MPASASGRELEWSTAGRGSALASAVGGPRILMAMGENRLLPKSEWLARKTKGGEPRNAVLLTAALSFACLMMRDLNAIAPLVTMFFLLTYLMINVVLLIEGSLKLVSFRPTLVVPRVVPLIGAVGCVFCMFIVSPIFGIVAVATVVATYVYIQRRGLPSKGDDVRSGMFVALADWAATKISVRDVESVRAWKPNLLVPFEVHIERAGELIESLNLIEMQVDPVVDPALFERPEQADG